MSIPVLQFLTAISWFIVALVVAQGTFRLVVGRGKPGDHSKSAFFFTAIIFVGGSSRWLLAPDDFRTWKLVYALTILLAFYVVLLAWNLRRDR